MELFAKPLFLIYMVPVLLGAIGILWLGRKLTRHYVRQMFGPAA